MKRIRKAAATPPLLQAYASAQPNADWEKFRNKAGRYQEVARQLREDQRDLCAYCEIDLLKSHDKARQDDFRVEHFHPKAPHAPPPNWALMWRNLLGVCHGGSQKDVVEASRFTAHANLHCCDVPKDNHDLTGIILNPLTDIPAFPRWFAYTESGAMIPDRENCPTNWRERASASIAQLNLDASRLRTLREAVGEALNHQIRQRLEQGLTEAQAAAEVAQAQFSGAAGEPWPAFFTFVRWYLGPAAEQRLRDLEYEG